MLINVIQVIKYALHTLFLGLREDDVWGVIKLLTSNFVERCLAPKPFIPAPVKVETTSKKWGANSAKVIIYYC